MAALKPYTVRLNSVDGFRHCFGSRVDLDELLTRLCTHNIYYYYLYKASIAQIGFLNNIKELRDRFGVWSTFFMIIVKIVYTEKMLYNTNKNNIKYPNVGN